MGNEGVHNLYKASWPNMKTIKKCNRLVDEAYNKLSGDGLSNNKLYHFPKLNKIISMEGFIYISCLNFISLEGKNTEVYLYI